LRDISFLQRPEIFSKVLIVLPELFRLVACRSQFVTMDTMADV